MAHDITTSPKKKDAKVRNIWRVFIILSIVTTTEVFLGITRPDFLTRADFLRMHLLNWVFICLTLYKAYLITWTFMHMKHETKGLRRSVVWTAAFLISYLIFILLTEGNYTHEVLENGFVAWDI